METINRLYEEWNRLLPLNPDDQKRLDTKFMLEFNYNSNHLEGNTLTYGQTKLLFMFGETSGNASLRDYEEMKAHNVGLEMVKQEAADRERPLSEAFIRQLNRTILVENFWKNAQTLTKEYTRMEVMVGEYKSRPNSVVTATGEIFHYASPEETPALMTDLVSWYNEEEKKGELSPIELATLLHYRYIRIHPFEDGNGRIARLLVNYVLLRHHSPMVIIRSNDKVNYLRILHQCDIAVGLNPSDGAHAGIEKIKPFLLYMMQQLEYAFNICIKAAKGESIEEEEDFEKRIALLEREAKEKRKGMMLKSDQAINWLLKEVLFKATDKVEGKLKTLNKFYNKIEYRYLLAFDRKEEMGYLYNDDGVLFFEQEDIPLSDVSLYKYLTFTVRAFQPTELLKYNSEIHTSISISLEQDKYCLNTENCFFYGKTPPDNVFNNWINDALNTISERLKEEVSNS